MLNVNIPRVGLDQCQAKVSSVNKIFVLWGDNTGWWCLDTITTMKTLNLFVTPAISSLICNIALLSHNSYQFCVKSCSTTSNIRMAMTILVWLLIANFSNSSPFYGWHGQSKNPINIPISKQLKGVTLGIHWPQAFPLLYVLAV